MVVKPFVYVDHLGVSHLKDPFLQKIEDPRPLYRKNESNITVLFTLL
jgi:hypothetical protein